MQAATARTFPASTLVGLAPDELIVDSFAGGGGASQGMEQALGRPIDIAINHDPGRILLPTARHIWDRLLEDRPEVEQTGTKTGADVETVFRRLRSEAERQGEDAFHELHARHQQRLKREQEKGRYAFQVRREALNRIGLPEVRQHRLKRLDEEEKAWAEELRKREQVLPELQAVALLRVEVGNG
jgi:hypothetical protein